MTCRCLRCTPALLERRLLIVPIEPQYIFLPASDSSLNGLRKHPKCTCVFLHFMLLYRRVISQLPAAFTSKLLVLNTQRALQRFLSLRPTEAVNCGEQRAQTGIGGEQ